MKKPLKRRDLYACRFLKKCIIKLSIHGNACKEMPQAQRWVSHENSCTRADVFLNSINPPFVCQISIRFLIWPFNYVDKRSLIDCLIPVLLFSRYYSRNEARPYEVILAGSGITDGIDEMIPYVLIPPKQASTCEKSEWETHWRCFRRPLTISDRDLSTNSIRITNLTSVT